MKNKLIYTLRSGKNPKFIYYVVIFFRQLGPKFLFRWRLKKELASLGGRKDEEYIRWRVDYYNQLFHPVALPLDAKPLAAHKMKSPKVYYFDTYEYTR